MKRISTIMTTLLLLAAPAIVMATNIHVDFTYHSTADGFRLFQNGVPVCDITDGTARTMDCDVMIHHDDEYTMSAITAGVPGPASAKHNFGRVRAVYKRMRGGAFSGGSM